MQASRKRAPWLEVCACSAELLLQLFFEQWRDAVARVLCTMEAANKVMYREGRVHLI